MKIPTLPCLAGLTTCERDGTSLSGIRSMILRSFLLTAILCLFASTTVPASRAATIAPDEKAKIEALISHLETLKDATFIRNGSDYDAKTAAKFLRRKWQSNEKEIMTAAEFITKVATGSSSSGKPYLIRRNGVETPCADYLTAQLKRLTAGEPGK